MTTIRISTTLKSHLDSLKLYRRETYEEVICRSIGFNLEDKYEAVKDEVIETLKDLEVNME